MILFFISFYINTKCCLVIEEGWVARLPLGLSLTRLRCEIFHFNVLLALEYFICMLLISLEGKRCPKLTLFFMHNEYINRRVIWDCEMITWLVLHITSRLFKAPSVNWNIGCVPLVDTARDFKFFPSWTATLHNNYKTHLNQNYVYRYKSVNIFNGCTNCGV